MRRRWRHRAPNPLTQFLPNPSPDTRRLKIIGGLVAVCLGFAALAGQGGTEPQPVTASSSDAIIEQAVSRDAAADVSRSQLERGLAAQAPPTPAAAPAAPAPPPEVAAAPAPPPPPAPPAEPVPVAGLDQTQMNNAKRIVDTAKSMGLGERAQVIAVATAMQESNLHNLASTTLPESSKYSDEGFGSDHDSVGLFQQRTSSGWGSVPELMTPEQSTRKFLNALVQVPGWDRMPLTAAAQQVQVSAFPDHYAKHEWAAAEVVHSLR